MYGRRRPGHGPLSYIIAGILGIAALMAVCKAFNYDPFGIIAWIIDSVTWLVTKIADVIYYSPFFKAMTGK